MKRLRSLDQISTFSCDYALDLALLINVPCDIVTLSCNNLWYVMNNMVVLDSKYSLLYCIKKYVLITILPTRLELLKKIRIEMKSINTDAWLVNFILSFSGLSPILFGPKVNFFKLMWHRRPQQCVHLLDSTQRKRARPNEISSKKATIGPNKIFFGLYEQRQPTRTVLGSTQLQTGQIHFMTHTICHNWHATSDATSDSV
jgi:hypothetical protein